jgi:hypothetical protein
VAYPPWQSKSKDQIELLAIEPQTMRVVLALRFNRKNKKSKHWFFIDRSAYHKILHPVVSEMKKNDAVLQ